MTYFPFGAPATWTWGNGEPMTRTFDLDGRVSTLTLGPAAGTYADLSQVFGYDNLNRMVSANLAAGQTQSFTYDSNSNRTNATINSASTTYNYPSNSHKLSSLSGATTQSFTYDNAGNLTLTAGVTYVYDGRGRMKQAGATTYLVNGLGQRVKKSSGSDTFFAYDEAGHLIGEYDASANPIEETIWLGDTPVAVVKPKTGGFDVFYIWSDNLGTPRMISDTTNAIRWQWDNADPFGNNAPNENPSGLGAFNYNLRFPGQYYDSETGKHYNYYRDYDPAIGRYVESDLIGIDGGLATYGYGLSDPLLYIDPLGLAFDLGRSMDFGVSFAAPIIGRVLGIGGGAGVTFRQCCENGTTYDEAYVSVRVGISVGASAQASGSGKGTFGVARFGPMPACVKDRESTVPSGLDFAFGPVSIRIRKDTLNAGISPGAGGSGTFNLGERKWSLGKRPATNQCACSK